MNDLVGRLYNGFLLRDLLGYVVPGSFVLACMVHLVSVAENLQFKDLSSLATSSVYAFIFTISLCYACGHFLSGLFFHSFPLKKIFSYSPKDIEHDYPGLNFDDAWVAHRTNYRTACDKIGPSTQGLIERHAALLHFTAHFCAGLLFVAIYIFGLALFNSSAKILIYEIPILILFPGIFVHYRRLSLERYRFERAAIEESTSREDHDRETGTEEGSLANTGS